MDLLFLFNGLFTYTLRNLYELWSCLIWYNILNDLFNYDEHITKIRITYHNIGLLCTTKKPFTVNVAPISMQLSSYVFLQLNSIVQVWPIVVVILDLNGNRFHSTVYIEHEKSMK